MLLLIGYILFLQQRRSYFVPGTQTPITMMDLQEYSYIDQAQRTTYINQLTNRSPMLTMNKTNMMAYQSNLNAIMQTAFNTPTMNVAPTGNFRIQSASGKFLGRPNSTTMALELMTSNVMNMFTYTGTQNIQHVQSGMNVMFMPSPMLTQQSVPVTLTKQPTGQYIIRQGTMEVRLDGNSLVRLAP
ncbi:hypothetical protein EBT25_02425 [bacterium]|nr:hypothetical protein [bacterium]